MSVSKIKLLLINSDSEEEINTTKKRIELSFEKDKISPVIDLFDSCEDAFTRARNFSRMEEYDAFVINAKKTDCFGHSFLDLICNSKITMEKPKIISSNIFANSSYDFISSRDYYFFPNRNIVQIRKSDFLRQDLLTEIFRTFIITPPKLFVSYGNDERCTSREIIEEFSKIAKVALPHCKIISDTEHLKTGDSLISFMESMSSGDGILLIANKRYFESKYCMKELSAIFPKLQGQIYPIFLDSGRHFFDSIGYSKIKEEWLKEKNMIEEAQQKFISLNSGRDSTLDDDIKDLQEVIDLLPGFRKYIADYFTLPINLYRNEKYIDIFQRITDDLSGKGYIKFYKSKEELIESLQNFNI